MKKLSTSIVAVKKITSQEPRSNFADSDLEKVATLSLEAEGLINPIVIRRTSLESYEVVDGDFEYHAAARAREIDPRKGEMVGAFILEPENEEVILEQIKILRKEKTTKAIIEVGSPQAVTNLENPITNIESRFEKQNKVSDLISELPPSSEKPQELQSLLQQFEKSFQEVEVISNTVKEVAESVKNIKETISTQIDVLRRILKSPETGKLNLTKAERPEIEKALSQLGANSKQKNAAWEAIQYWKKPGKDLTWKNLEKSTKAGSDKVIGFAKATYDKLKQIADISE
jgi:hypothetical protein